MTLPSWRPWVKLRPSTLSCASDHAAASGMHILCQAADNVSSSSSEPPSSRVVLGSPTRKEVILVTGGAGFLGQHIVRLLQERASNVGEIRVFDTRPYRNKLGHMETIPVRSVVGDVRKLTELRIATRDVTTVIHTAGVVSFGTFPDVEAMNDVNAKGTANVIQACVEQNVDSLVYTSSVDVVIARRSDVISDGDESLPVPRRFLFQGYAESKRRAEALVCDANGRALAKGNGSVLSTLVLRPSVMYGELDPWYVVSGLQTAHRHGGILLPVGDGSARMQVSYAGNVAWAHLCAARCLRLDPGQSSGRCYFITDDTPVLNSFQTLKPYLKERGYSLSDSYLPYPLAYTVYLVVDWLLWAIRPIHEINLEVSLPSIVYVNRMLTFSRQRAEETLGYRPVYDHGTSFARSLRYYRDVPL